MWIVKFLTCSVLSTLAESSQPWWRAAGGPGRQRSDEMRSSCPDRIASRRTMCVPPPSDICRSHAPRHYEAPT
jgi:hypothetical protein